MRNWKIAALVAGCSALGACDWVTGRHDDEDPFGNETVSAEGKAETGQVAVKAPGLDVTFTVPKALTRDVKVNSDIKILYPRASITGMYAAGGSGKDEGESEVEFRFGSPDAPDRITAWYQDPARAPLFKVESVARDGGDILIRARDKQGDGEFRLRLAPRQGGGTDGRLVIHKKD
jgi:hypothetical protein